MCVVGQYCWLCANIVCIPIGSIVLVYIMCSPSLHCWGIVKITQIIVTSCGYDNKPEIEFVHRDREWTLIHSEPNIITLRLEVQTSGQDLDLSSWSRLNIIHSNLPELHLRKPLNLWWRMNRCEMNRRWIGLSALFSHFYLHCLSVHLPRAAQILLTGPDSGVALSGPRPEERGRTPWWDMELRGPARTHTVFKRLCSISDLKLMR